MTKVAGVDSNPECIVDLVAPTIPRLASFVREPRRGDPVVSLERAARDKRKHHAAMIRATQLPFFLESRARREAPRWTISPLRNALA